MPNHVTKFFFPTRDWGCEGVRKEWYDKGQEWELQSWRGEILSYKTSTSLK